MAGTMTVLAAADTYMVAKAGELPETISETITVAGRYLSDGAALPAWVFVPCSVLLFLLGCILPDADHEFSPVGKVFHVPVAHRTWLHSIWFLLLFAIPGVVFGTWLKCLVWLAIGCFMHMFYDMFSASGIHWLYPYKKKRHFLKLYHTGDPSEYVFVTLVTLAAVAYTVFCVWTLFRPGPKII